MNVIIVDDEPAARRALRECCEHESDLRVLGEYGDTTSALDAIRSESPDLLFLDIQIDNRTGIDLVRALDPRSLPLIVFVTAYDQYAVEAFDVSAVDYLLKPFDNGRFQRTLGRVRQRHSTTSPADRLSALSSVLEQLEQRTQRLAISRPRVIAEFGGRMRMLDVADIEVVEADRNYVRLTVGRDTYTVRGTLQQVERSLASQPILRISRSCLVNVGHVREISKTARGDVVLVLAGGATVTSSEGYRESVRQYLDRMKIAPGLPVAPPREDS